MWPTVKHELLPARNRQEGNHVAAGERSDERLLGIDIGRIAEIGRSRRRRQHMIAVEAPSMVTRVLLIAKFGAAASLCAQTCVSITVLDHQTRPRRKQPQATR